MHFIRSITTSWPNIGGQINRIRPSSMQSESAGRLCTRSSILYTCVTAEDNETKQN